MTATSKLPMPTSSSSGNKSNPVTITLVIIFYFVTSLSVVFLNKFILSYSSYKFPYALTVTWFQMIVAWVILVAWGRIALHRSGRQPYPVLPPKDVTRVIAPLTIIYVLMLAFNNLCLQYVEVTFYQVARSLTIIFSTIFTYTFLGTKTSKPALTACAIVFVGFVLGSYGELKFSWLGVIFGLLSSAFVALYGIFVKKALRHVDDDQWRLLQYNTSLSVMMIAPLVFFSGEIADIRAEVDFLDSVGFWTIMTLTGVGGFLINVAMFLQIKYTTPLTNTISGTAKACVQTLLAAMIFQNPISGLNATGIFLSLVGSTYYSVVRYQEMVRRQMYAPLSTGK